jgi:hypothetical protein
VGAIEKENEVRKIKDPIVKKLIEDIESGKAEKRTREQLDLVTWNKDMAIAACVDLARDPRATEAERLFAQNTILLLTGAVDAFKSRIDGSVHYMPETYLRMHPNSPDEDRIRAAIATRDAIQTADYRARLTINADRESSANPSKE